MMRELVTHLWQSTLFAFAVALLTFAFRKNRAQVRYWLWLTASLKFFVPFALLIGFGSHLGWAPAAQKIATPAVSFAVEYVAQPFSEQILITPPTVSRDWTPQVIAGLWIVGLLIIALMRLRLWLRVRAAVRGSVPLEIPSSVRIRSAAGLLEPGVVGLWRPTLLLPEGIMERLTPSELEAVIAHELCHVRRRDNLFSSIHMLVEGIFWFHPLVWWIGARLLEERERACDENVLSLGNQPRVYADAILNVCKLYTESPLVCVSGVTGSDIKRRIEAIMMNRIGLSLNRAKKLLLAGAGVAALAGPVAVGVLIAVGHLPAIHAQSPLAQPLPTLAAKPPAQTVQTLAPQPVPTLAARPPVQLAQAIPTIPNTPQPTTNDTTPASGAIRYQDRRLVAMFFDFGGMAADEQSKSRQAAIQFVENSLKPADLVCVMGAGPVTVAQDFTDNKSILESAIQNLSAGAGAASVDGRLANIETVSKMLAGFPEKKALMYFSGGITQSGMDNQAALLALVNTAKKANVAIYPVDARGIVAEIGAMGGSGRGPATARPAGISLTEYNQRVAEAQQKFGSTSSEMARIYITYGPPDRIDSGSNPQKPSQLWRYNYLSGFHSSTEFEFSQEKSVNNFSRMDINYPPGLATYLGMAVADTSLVAELSRENNGRGPSSSALPPAGFPGRHATMSVYPAGERSKLTVPLDSLSGLIDIIAQVKTRPAAGSEAYVVGNLRDSVTLNGTSTTALYGTGFALDAGSYVCRVLVRESATGKIYGEVINFDVK